jgi:hypothetical protein
MHGLRTVASIGEPWCATSDPTIDRATTSRGTRSNYEIRRRGFEAR